MTADDAFRDVDRGRGCRHPAGVGTSSAPWSARTSERSVGVRTVEITVTAVDNLPDRDVGLVVSEAEISTVRISRERRGNSVTPALMDELAVRIGALDESDAVRGVVLSGTERIFCSGADLTELGEMWRSQGTEAVVEYLSERWMPSVQAALRAVWYARLPIVAAVNGAATAGGLDLALCCTYRVAGTSARLGETYVRLGLVPVAGGSALLPWLGGMGRAGYLLLTGQLFPADQAVQWGIVDEVVEDHAVVDTATQRVAEMCEAEPATARELLRLVRSTDDARFEHHLDHALKVNRELLRRHEVQAKLTGTLRAY